MPRWARIAVALLVVAAIIGVLLRYSAVASRAYARRLTLAVARHDATELGRLGFSSSPTKMDDLAQTFFGQAKAFVPSTVDAKLQSVLPNSWLLFPFYGVEVRVSGGSTPPGVAAQMDIMGIRVGPGGPVWESLVGPVADSDARE